MQIKHILYKTKIYEEDYHEERGNCKKICIFDADRWNSLAFLVGTGIFFGILCLANSSIAGSIALNIGGLMGITAFIAIPVYFLRKY